MKYKMLCEVEVKAPFAGGNSPVSKEMEKAGSIWFSSEENKGESILNLIDSLEGCRKIFEKSWGNEKKVQKQWEDSSKKGKKGM